MKFEMTSGGGSPPGTYPAKFTKIEPFESEVTTEKGYGPAVKMIWEVTDGDQAGVENSAVCSAKMSPKSKLGGFALSFNGGPITIGEAFDFADHVNRTGTIVVEDSPSGNGTRVTSFFPAN